MKEFCVSTPSCSHNYLDRCFQSISNFKSSPATISCQPLCYFASSSSRLLLSSISSRILIIVIASCLFLLLSSWMCFLNSVRFPRRPMILSASLFVHKPWLGCEDYALSTSSLNLTSRTQNLSTLKYVTRLWPSFVVQVIGVLSESGLGSE